MKWLPFLTFWQVTCDMIISLKPGPGHGHHYGAEVPTAWAAILHPPHWTDEDTATLAGTPRPCSSAQARACATIGRGLENRMCRAIAQLVSAAHPHQREANPSITRTASTATAIRLTRPKVAMC